MADEADGTFIDAAIFNPITFDSGDVKWSARRTPPSGWLLCDGSAVSRSTYASLFDAIVPSLGTFTVSIASPGVFTIVAHGLAVGDSVYLETTGALPTGLASDTLYYVVSTPSADTFELSATRGGSAINTSGSQSGTHTAFFCPFGLGDGSTTFNVPDMMGRGPVGNAATIGGKAGVSGLGNNEGVTNTLRNVDHHHGISPGAVTDTAGATTNLGPSPGVNLNNITTGDSDNPDTPAYLVLNPFVKT